MSLASRLTALAQAVGTDIKSINVKIATGTKTLDPWHTVNTAGEPQFLNSFNGVAGDASPQFRKDVFGRVFLRGTLGVGASGAVAFILPVGYRPKNGRVRNVSINNQGASGWGQVNIGTDGTVTVWYDTVGGIYVSLDQISFDTDSITELTVLTTGVAQSAVALDTPHIVGAAGEPAFKNSWTNNSVPAYGSLKFSKDPLGRVWVNGAVSGGASGSVVFTLPAGYRPPIQKLADQLQSGAVSGTYAQVATSGDVIVAFTAAPVYVDFSFDTETVTLMPTGPQGAKGDPGGVGLVKTLNWNTAILPNAYRSTNEGLEQTINGPGDSLNPPPQAGIVSVHENGSVVQRVWDLSYQKPYTRYLLAGTWTAWVADYVKPPIVADVSVGGSASEDGDVRYFQNAAMKALGIIWQFRYDKTAPTGKPKWVFIGGTPIRTTTGTGLPYTTGNAAYSWGVAMTAPKYTLPVSGDFNVDYKTSCQSGTAGDLRTAAFINNVSIPDSDSFGSIGPNTINAHFSADSIALSGVAGQVIDLRMMASIASAATNVYSRSLTITPIRVVL